LSFTLHRVEDEPGVFPLLVTAGTLQLPVCQTAPTEVAADGRLHAAAWRAMLRFAFSTGNLTKQGVTMNNIIYIVGLIVIIIAVASFFGLR
jgi:hypothetical protein